MLSKSTLVQSFYLIAPFKEYKLPCNRPKNYDNRSLIAERDSVNLKEKFSDMSLAGLTLTPFKSILALSSPISEFKTKEGTKNKFGLHISDASF